jgi:hypothetical protein
MLSVCALSQLLAALAELGLLPMTAPAVWHMRDTGRQCHAYIVSVHCQCTSIDACGASHTAVADQNQRWSVHNTGYKTLVVRRVQYAATHGQILQTVLTSRAASLYWVRVLPAMHSATSLASPASTCNGSQ